MRLDKFIALQGIASRSQAKELVKKGKVLIQGSPVKHADTDIPEGERVWIDGTEYVCSEYEYYLLYKPAGYLTARSDTRQPVVMELVPSKRTDLAPVGRLDADTEGVLLITNDGALAHELLSPRKHVKKTYYAELDRELPPDAEMLLKQPMEFSDFTSAPADAFEKLDARKALLTISEGKFHQVKRMFHAIGCEVTYLKRVSFGCLTLDGMKPGECRKLTAEETETLKR